MMEVATTPATTALVRDWIPGLKPSHVIRADYSGGAYIELTFGSEDFQPSEVINVWDYEHGQPEGRFSNWENVDQAERVRLIGWEVQDWILMLHEEGWDAWYQDYITNAR